MPLTLSNRLGPYEIVAPLGSGMGEVYRARDTRLGRHVAVKLLPADLASRPDLLERFEREARTVAALNHRNIVTLHSIEESGGVRFLTMELVEGQTLAALVTPGGLPLARLLDFSIALADALAAAHDKGVVHRDLKPGNVMVTREGRLKVLDFGLAKLAATGPGHDLTHAATVAQPISSPGQLVGTLPYMAPEQLVGEAVDARSDLFSFGIIVHELATGSRPFEGVTHVDLSHAIVHDPPAPLSRVRADLAGDLERVVSLCLEKDPRDRIQSARALADELRRARRVLERGEARPRGNKPLDPTTSIAVLPFANRSAAAVAEVGHALNVATVLEGSVRKAGNRVRISVQLVKVADGYHLWSETYDRTLDDIFAVQDDIAQSVVKELRVTLLGGDADSQASGEARADVAAAARGRGTDPEAHRLFLQGRFFSELNSAEGLQRSVTLLRQALERDPAHAMAWACLCRTLVLQAGQGFAPVNETNTRAREAAMRAVELEPDLADGHIAGAWWRSGTAGTGARPTPRCAAPSSWRPGPRRRCACPRCCRTRSGGPTRRWTTPAAPSSRIHSMRSYTVVGRPYMVAGRFREAEAVFRKAVEISPDGVAFRLLLSMSLFEQGRLEEALAEAQREPAAWARRFGLCIIHHALGHAAESEHALAELTRDGSDDSAYQIAQAHAIRGETDAAFAWLDRAYASRDAGLSVVKPALRFRSLHGDPRWAAFLRKMGLPE